MNDSKEFIPGNVTRQNFIRNAAAVESIPIVKFAMIEAQNENLASPEVRENPQEIKQFDSNFEIQRQKGASLLKYKKLVVALLLLFLPLLSVGQTSVTTQRTAKPKILLLYDMEGISGVNRLAQTTYPNPDYKDARHLLTADVNAAIRGLKAGGAGEIIVIDGHGSDNFGEPDILLAEMDKRAVMGFRDAPFDAYTSPDATFRAIVSIGAHASTGKPGFLSHTRSRISTYKVNGVELTESSIIALAGTRFGIPLIMVSGDDVLQMQIKEQFPNAEYSVVKKARGVGQTELLSFDVAHKNIERAAEAAIKKLSTFKPLSISKPFNFELSYQNRVQANYASDYPGVQRLDNLTVGFTTYDVVEGISFGRMLTRLAAREFRDVLLEVIKKRPDGEEILKEWERQLEQRWLNPSQEAVTSAPVPAIPSNTAPVKKQQFWGSY